jgi:hypothetical protein
MTITNTHEIAIAFSNYVRHHDPRAQALAEKADTTFLTEKEMEELVIRLNKLHTQFMKAHQALLGRNT